MVHEEQVRTANNDNNNDYLEEVKRIIDNWPEWKKEIFQKLVRLTT